MSHLFLSPSSQAAVHTHILPSSLSLILHTTTPTKTILLLPYKSTAPFLSHYLFRNHHHSPPSLTPLLPVLAACNSGSRRAPAATDGGYRGGRREDGKLRVLLVFLKLHFVLCGFSFSIRASPFLHAPVAVRRV